MMENKEKYIHYPHFELIEKGPIKCQEKLAIKAKQEDQIKPFWGNLDSLSEQRLLKTKSKLASEVVYEGYGPQVLTTNWFVPYYSYPKDYDAYNPPGGDYFRSSYNRWGVTDEKMTTETRDAQETFMRELKKKKPRCHRPLLNVFTLQHLNPEQFPTLVSEVPDKKFKKPCEMYLSAMQKDYINHYPREPKMIDRTELNKPVTKYRNLLTEIAHPRRPGYNKFYDENLEYLNAKKTTKIDPPPYALHYTPVDELNKETPVKKDEKDLDIKEEPCAKCT